MSVNGRSRVVVTGMGTVNPLGMTLEDYADGLIEGRSTAHTIERYSTERLNTKFACLVEHFDPAQHLDRKLVSRTARFTQLALVAAQNAVRDAGLDVEKEDSFRVGVEMGTGIGGFTEIYEAAKSYSAGTRLSPFFAPSVIHWRIVLYDGSCVLVNAMIGCGFMPVGL